MTGSENNNNNLEKPQTDDESYQAKAEVAEIDSELDELIRQKEQLTLIAQRAQADLINYRKRATEEINEAKRSVNTSLLLKIFSALDDFQRAIDLVPDEAVAPGWLEGIHLVYKKIETMIDSEGVSKIEAVGKIFNPRECEAVVYEESSSAAEGEVTKVFREGYKQRDRIIRPAQVVVAKKIQQEQEPDESEESN